MLRIKKKKNKRSYHLTKTGREIPQVPYATCPVERGK
jgi:hypothetical protein